MINDKSELRRRKTDGVVVDLAVFNWFCETRDNNLLITGPLIKHKALDIVYKLLLHDFKAYNGWLARFCQRHNINLRTIPHFQVRHDVIDSPITADLRQHWYRTQKCFLLKFQLFVHKLYTVLLSDECNKVSL